MLALFPSYRCRTWNKSLYNLSKHSKWWSRDLIPGTLSPEYESIFIFCSWLITAQHDLACLLSDFSDMPTMQVNLEAQRFKIPMFFQQYFQQLGKYENSLYNLKYKLVPFLFASRPLNTSFTLSLSMHCDWAGVGDLWQFLQTFDSNIVGS